MVVVARRTRCRVLLAPTAYLVDSNASSISGSGSSGTLSYVVVLANANTNPAGSQITFDPTEFSTPQTITLASTLVLSEASGAEVIDASNVSPVTISGTDVAGSPVIQVGPGLTATLKDLRIINGSGSGEGGGISNAGTLTLSAVNLVDDKASREAPLKMRAT